MIPEQIIADTFLVAEALILIFLGLYVVFTIVIIKQVRLMTDTLDVDLDGFIRLLSFIHLFFAGAVLLVALFTL